MRNANWLTFILCFLLCLASTLSISGCTGGALRPGWVRMRFQSEGGEPTEAVDLEIVSTTPERMKGLMFRREMPANEGMIFVFPDEEEQSFWMRNTYLSLDMLFVDQKFKVVGILENVPVLNDQPRTVGIPSMYVIELNAGASKRLGIKVGSVGTVEGVLPRGT